MERFVMAAPQCSLSYVKYHGQDPQIFPGNMEITEMDDVESCVSELV